MERQMEEGAGNAVHPDEDQARLIGEILAEFIAGLGRERAMFPEALVVITPADRGGLVGRGALGATPEHFVARG